eukprot:jgi/Chlat1/9263/Chrsp99S08488
MEASKLVRSPSVPTSSVYGWMNDTWQATASTPPSPVYSLNLPGVTKSVRTPARPSRSSSFSVHRHAPAPAVVRSALPSPSQLTAMAPSITLVGVRSVPTPSILDTAELLHNLPWDARGMMPVVAHRGCGKNDVTKREEFRAITDPDIRENTILSFNTAAELGADFVEFDVQVTKDNVPVLFHDTFIVRTDKSGATTSTPVSALNLNEFKQPSPSHLLRRDSSAIVHPWMCAVEDSMPTLEEAFTRVPSQVGFNVELKLPFPTDDGPQLTEVEKQSFVDATLEVCEKQAYSRRIVYSSFDPDAVIYLRKRQSKYPVFFLTEAGADTYTDDRRNSIASAVKVALDNNLHGVVSYVKPLIANPFLIRTVKDAGLLLMTYGSDNNLVDSLRLQEQFGVDAVIVDKVYHIVTAAQSRPSQRADVVFIPNMAMDVFATTSPPPSSAPVGRVGA